MTHAAELFERRQRRVRYRVKQTLGERKRLSVFRSNQHIYAQIIDDAEGKTIVSASSLDKELVAGLKNGGNKDAAAAVGKLIAERAKKAKVEAVAFDRGGYNYHGRVKALAEAAREHGLKF
jgi:large subunit ribosomal protein L18